MNYCGNKAECKSFIQSDTPFQSGIFTNKQRVYSFKIITIGEKEGSGHCRGNGISVTDPGALLFSEFQNPSLSFLGEGVCGEQQGSRVCSYFRMSYIDCILPLLYIYFLSPLSSLSWILFPAWFCSSPILWHWPPFPCPLRVDKPVPWLPPTPQSSLTPTWTGKTGCTFHREKKRGQLFKGR